ncbi:MAG: hypothetical protein JXN62_12925 [Bacteroidales bacterium]|nr:hypothetical protein [Bacteroidales bacterium]
MTPKEMEKIASLKAEISSLEKLLSLKQIELSNLLSDTESKSQVNDEGINSNRQNNRPLK